MTQINTNQSTPAPLAVIPVQNPSGALAAFSEVVDLKVDKADLVAIASARFENTKRSQIAICHKDLTAAQAEKARLETQLATQIADVRTQVITNNPFTSSLAAIATCAAAGVALKATHSLSAASPSDLLVSPVPVTQEELALDPFAANPWLDKSTYERGPAFSSIFFTWTMSVNKDGDKADYSGNTPSLNFTKVRALPVPPAITRTRDLIATQDRVISSLTEEINGYRRELTNMASVERQARAAIATATLSSSEQGNRLLDHLLGAKDAQGVRSNVTAGVQAMPLLPETAPTFKPNG